MPTPLKTHLNLLKYFADHNCGVEVYAESWDLHRRRERLQPTGGPDKYRSFIDRRVLHTLDDNGWVSREEFVSPHGLKRYRMTTSPEGLEIVEQFKHLLDDDGRLLITKIPRFANYSGGKLIRVGVLCRIRKETANRFYVEVEDLGDFETHHGADIKGVGDALYIEADKVQAVGVTREQHDRLKQAYRDYDASLLGISTSEQGDPEVQALMAELAAVQKRLDEARRRHLDRVPQRQAQLEAEIAEILGDSRVEQAA